MATFTTIINDINTWRRRSKNLKRLQRFLRIHWYAVGLAVLAVLAVLGIFAYLVSRSGLMLAAFQAALLLAAVLPTVMLKLTIRRMNRRLALTWKESRSHRKPDGAFSIRPTMVYPRTGVKHRIHHGYWFIWTGGPQVPAERLVLKADKLTRDLKVYRCDVEEVGTLEAKVTVWRTDPLTEPPYPDFLELMPLDPRTAELYAGWDQKQQPTVLELKDKTGMSIAGYPGSGKTVLMLRLALEAYLGGARVFIANGKGDDSFKAFAALGIRCVDEGKQAFLEWLQHLEQLRRDRMNEPQHNYVVIVIDELQEYLTTYCKDEKPLVEQITALLVNLARKQRSSSMFMVYGSQKIDSTAIPTAFRDLFELRLSGATPSSTVTRIALGELREDDPQPHDFNVIPAGSHGRFIVKGQGPTTLFQAANLTETQIRKVIQARLRERSEQQQAKGATTTAPLW
jgi:hypothetical protein